MTPRPPLVSEPTPIGEQTLVTGVAPITSVARLVWRAAEPLSSCKAQKAANHGLFDLAARDQLDLFRTQRNLP